MCVENRLGKTLNTPWVEEKSIRFRFEMFLVQTASFHPEISYSILQTPSAGANHWCVHDQKLRLHQTARLEH